MTLLVLLNQKKISVQLIVCFDCLFDLGGFREICINVISYSEIAFRFLEKKLF